MKLLNNNFTMNSIQPDMMHLKRKLLISLISIWEGKSGTTCLFSCFIIFIVTFIPFEAWAFWNTCIDFNRSNSTIVVMDPDIMGLENHSTKEYAFIGVDCPEDRPNVHPFSRCANGCPIYPASSIKVPKGIEKLCEGDIIYIYKKQCRIGHMRKGRDK